MIRLISVGRAPSVGVAQHQPLRPRLPGGPYHRQSVLGVGPVAVEEVLGVEEHPPPLCFQILHRLGGHADTLVEVGAKSLSDVIVPGLSHDADDLGLRLQKSAYLGIGLHPPGGSTGGSKSGEFAVRQGKFGFGPGEELVVFGEGARPAALYEMDAQGVEEGGDAQLVGDGERNSLLLGAVAEGGVVDFEFRVNCGGHSLFSSGQSKSPLPGRGLGTGFGRADAYGSIMMER